mgnify:CR=1 FL=1
MWSKIRKTPFKILMQKGIQKGKKIIYNSRQMDKDLKKGSFQDENINSEFIGGIFPLFQFNRIEIKEDLIQSILDHKFKIFSDSLSSVNYNDSHDLKKNKDIKLSKINESNREISRSYLDQIKIPYKLIAWNKDQLSNYLWEIEKWSNQITYGDVEGADIKYPWELGRLQHLLVLAISISKSKDQRLIDEYCNQLYDFIGSNPPRFGTQWMTSMDVSLRLISILTSYDVITQSGIRLDELHKTIAYTTKIHLDHIVNNNEWAGGQRGNHYFANMCALAIGGSYFKGDYFDDFMLNGIKSLLEELFYQFNDDGGNFEASLPYHFFVLEMLLWTLKLLLNISDDKKELINNSLNGDLILGDNKIWFKKKYLERLISIIKFSRSTVFNYGIPQIGDNDSGKFIDLRSINYNALSILSEVEIGLGFISFASTEKQIINSLDHYFDKTGFYVKKSDQLELVVRAGKIGQNGKGGHDHNDQLSFELAYKSQAIIVDPGTYNYTAYPEKRNLFRSTESHNLMFINGLEQNTFEAKSKDDLFWIREELTKTKLVKHNSKIFSAEIYSYDKPYKRSFLFGDSISIVDECEADGLKQLNIHFHPDVSLVKDKNTCIADNHGSIIQISFSIDFIIDYYNYSNEYGRLSQAPMIKLINIKNDISWEIQLK